MRRESDLARLQMQVRTYMNAGRSLESVEEKVIDTARDLTSDQKAALWLYAWSNLPGHRQRAAARRYLQDLAEDSIQVGS